MKRLTGIDVLARLNDCGAVEGNPGVWISAAELCRDFLSNEVNVKYVQLARALARLKSERQVISRVEDSGVTKYLIAQERAEQLGYIRTPPRDTVTIGGVF